MIHIQGHPKAECCLCRIAAAPAPAPKAKQRRWGKARPYTARVVALESLCRAQPLRGAEAKDTVRAELDLGDSGLAYTPGDALGIFPLNCPQAAPRPEPACVALTRRQFVRPGIRSWQLEHGIA